MDSNALNRNVPLVHAVGVAKSFDGVPALRNGQFLLQSGSVHALCGGNGAGKSTFLSILMGILKRDDGTIEVAGKEVDFSGPLDAIESGIAIITQELSPVPHLSVAENIYLGREPRTAKIVVDTKKMRADADALLKRLGFDIDPAARIASLSVAQIQLVEIAKAFSFDAQIIIMDEPTSAIGERETHVLFDAIRRLTKQGVGFIYVSHRLEEIFDIADTYTVFRDGEFVETGDIASIDRAHLVRQIVGREVAEPRQSSRTNVGETLLEIKELSWTGKFEDVSLRVAAGEILGIYGLMGSGRTEFVSSVFGISPRDAGSVRFGGAEIPAERPDKALHAGISMVTEDRKESGLVLSSSIRHNISLTALRKFSWRGVIDGRKEREHANDMIRRLFIKTASDNLAVSTMSGGNQQKVVIARCLSTKPKLLICDEPTRGIDEGAKQEIYSLLDGFVRDGGAVLMVSSEAPEVLQLSDRIAIFKKGRLSQMLPTAGANQEMLLHAAS
ncbi:sugar ABC transporter ATP-binding protein [Paraburkholderia caribensis]|uniref:sugar ABC transporter ATP-binding protein n=1 Tax=Paraburkholderia caribensis TaxID=75105 RepID=UPI00158FB2A2|nr:sugar ABC transporter ATP-binding protein [Paraburkholderia caribensis]